MIDIVLFCCTIEGLGRFTQKVKKGKCKVFSKQKLTVTIWRSMSGIYFQNGHVVLKHYTFTLYCNSVQRAIIEKHRLWCINSFTTLKRIISCKENHLFWYIIWLLLLNKGKVFQLLKHGSCKCHPFFFLNIIFFGT